MCQSGITQAPDAMKYQSIVRDAGGNVLANQQVGIQISILQGVTEVYVESHIFTSNSYGLVNLVIGEGIVSSGDFSTIDWGTGPYFVKVGVDPQGGTNYNAIMGTSQLLSVPYALYAENTGETELPSNPEAGDIIFYDGLNWERLPKGNDGQVLSLSGGLPVWKDIFPPLSNSPYTNSICINGMAADLLDVDPFSDVDGDGDDDFAAITVSATDFLVKPLLENFTYSINKAGETPDQTKTSITLTCDDPATLIVEIHRWDGNTDVGFCETYFLVQDPLGHCAP